MRRIVAPNEWASRHFPRHGFARLCDDGLRIAGRGGAFYAFD